MSKKRISLRDEKGLIVESTIVDNFSIEKIPKIGKWNIIILFGLKIKNSGIMNNK